MSNPIICAIDTTNVAKAKQLASEVAGSVGAIKLGLEFFTANGAGAIREVAQNIPLFLDLKFHDIPNTVAGAIRATAGINCFLMTVHAAGGKAMLQAAKLAAEELVEGTGKPRPMVVAVTILTSMDQQDLDSVGYQNSVKEQVKKMAGLAQESGLDGVVCSPHEIEVLRAQCGADFKLIVPGIRPAGSESGDQKRVLTPKDALKKGASYLVIGRPITGAANPAQAAADILQSIS